MPGTPRKGFDFQGPYLCAVLSMIGLDQNLEFVHTEPILADAHRVVQELASA